VNALYENIPIAHICQIVEIRPLQNEQQLSVFKMEKEPPVRFAWLNIGSQGRKEQLLLTDQDNALVFQDVAADRHDEVKNILFI
jgi:CBS domain-containing protein